MRRTQLFSAFLCYRKNHFKCSACVVSQKIAIELKNCALGNTRISQEPLVIISRNLARKILKEISNSVECEQ